MDAVLRKLKLRRSDGKDCEARKKLQKSLFSYEKNLLLGFPTNSISFAVDYELGLLAIATKFGDIKIFGKPGLQFSLKLSSKAEYLYFLPEQARLIALCFDSSIQMIELNTTNGVTSAKTIKRFKALVGEEKSQWTSCISQDSKVLTFCASASSDVKQFDLDTFAYKEKSLTRQTILDIIPEESKEASGRIVSIVQLSNNSNKYLIGFSQGVIVMWDSEAGTASIACSAVQPLENMHLNITNEELMTAHSDGSYMTWKFVDDSLKFVDKVTPYGPFPCEAIRKVITGKCPAGDSIVIFSGGSGRSSVDNDYMITLTKGSNNYIFDETTSKVVDFQVVNKNGSAEWLFILWADQIACVNLGDSGYPAIDNPLFTTHRFTPISCIESVSNIANDMVEKLKAAGCNKYPRTAFSENWPLKGGEVESPIQCESKNLLIVGHENGDVSFWQDDCVGLEWLCTWATRDYFKTEVESTSKHANKYGPPEFDPHFAILKMSFDTISGTLIVAGANGQVIVAILSPGGTPTDETLSVEFSDHGEEVLVRAEGVKSEIATVQAFIQMLPPRPCTALAYNHKSKLLATATNDGFAVFDLVQTKIVFTKCTPAMSYSVTRSMSFSNTLRESFRNLKKRVPSPYHIRKVGKPAASIAAEENKDATQPEETLVAEIVEDIKDGMENVENAAADVKEKIEQAAVEVKDVVASEIQGKKEAIVEAVEKVENDLKELVTGEEGDVKIAPMSPDKVRDDKQVTFDATPVTPSKTYSIATPLHPVSALHFNETYIIQNSSVAAMVLMAGTRNGHVLIYQLVLPKEESRSSEDVTCSLAKEIHLKHGASTVSLMVIDRNGKPVCGPTGEASDTHKLVVVSQEQIKIFNLPSLKPYNKYKFFATNSESHLRYLNTVLFKSLTDETYSEWGVVCVASNGGLTVLNMLQLRPQLKINIDTNDGQFRKVAVSNSGVGFCIINDGFDLVKFSVSATNPGRMGVSLALKEGMRPVVVKETVAEKEDLVAKEEVIISEAAHVAHETPKVKDAKQNCDKVPLVNGHHVTNGECNGDSMKHMNSDMNMEDIGEPYLVMESCE